MRHRFSKLARTLKLGLVLTDTQTIFHKARCDNITFHRTPEWEEQYRHDSESMFPFRSLLLHMEVCCHSSHLAGKPAAPFSARTMWISPFVPFETALFHIQSPAAFYSTLPTILKPAVRACLLSSTGSEEEEGWFFDLSIMRKNALISLWL